MSFNIRTAIYGSGCILALGSLGTDFVGTIPIAGNIASALFNMVGYMGIAICAFILFITAKRMTSKDCLALAMILATFVEPVIDLIFQVPAVGTIGPGAIFFAIDMIGLSILYDPWR